MPKPSLREVYEAVVEVSRAMRSKARDNPPIWINAKYLINLLFASPREVKVGEWWRQDRKVHLPQPTLWSFVNDKRRVVKRMRVLAETQLSPEISRINLYFRSLDSPFRAWSSCKRGNPRVKTGGNCRKARTPFLIGLVDTRRPMKSQIPE